MKHRAIQRLFTVMIAIVLVVTGVSTVHAENPSRETVLKNLVKNKNMKARILWYDLSANLEKLNTPEKVADIVAKTANANFNTIVLDVKNPSGFVAYPSEHSPHLSTSANPRYSNYPEGYDLIEEVLKEAKKYNLEVHLSMNTFSAGNVPYNEGPSIENPEWQTVVYDVNRVLKDSEGNHSVIDGFNKTRESNQLIIYTPDKHETSPANRWGIDIVVEDDTVVEIVDRVIIGEREVHIPENGYVISGHGNSRVWLLEHIEAGEQVDISQVETDLKPISETNATEVFMNPIHPEVQQFNWDIIRELVQNYDIDGITLDRGRYNNVYTDFSDLSRQKFEEEIGQQVANWPEDIFRVEYDGNEKVNVPGPLYKEWIKWRAGNIHDFFEQTREYVKDWDDEVLFNTYVGSWHPLYYSEGVNWGSKRYQPDYDWVAEDYHETGYAGHLDFLMTGLYYGDVTIGESDQKGLPYWYSVEGAADLSMEVSNYDTFTYGSLFLLQYQNRPEDFVRAIEMTERKMHGIMLFDLIYIEDYDWWPLIGEAFDKKTKSPHTVPGLLKKLQK